MRGLAHRVFRYRTPPRHSVFPVAVVEELVLLGKLDQEVRAGITPAVRQDTALMGRILRTDSTHTQRLQKIVTRYGWPTPRNAGPDAAKAAFLIVQHSPDLSFQSQVLPELEAAVQRAEAPADEVALVTDRILVDERQPQRYRTQFQMANGKMVMYAVKDEDGLASS